MSNKNKKVLISGYIGFSNFGDDIMLSVLVDHLKKKNCNITALSSNPELTKKQFGINAAPYKSFLAVLSNILKTNVFISGGGNLFQNETSFLNLFYYLTLILVAKFFFKKVVVLSQGIGPITGSFSTWFTKFVLKKVDMIVVRDLHSQRMLSKWGIHSKYSYDISWSAELPEYSPRDIVGIQIRDYKHMHEDFFANLAKYTDMFFSDYEIRIYMLENKHDAQVAYSVEKALKKRSMALKTRVIQYKDHKTLIEEFSHLKYLIAMRLHANILGLKLGVKVLPLSYSDKVRNMASEFDVKYGEASEDFQWHPLLTDLTMDEQTNGKIEDAKKRAFEWTYLDLIIDK